MNKVGLVVAFACIVVLSPVGHTAAVDWTCKVTLADRPESRVLTYSVDIQAAKLDGDEVGVSGRVITSAKTFPDGEKLYTSIDLDTGDIKAQATVRGLLFHGKCVEGRVAPTSTVSTAAADNAAVDPPPTTSADERATKLHQSYVFLSQQARAGKLKYLQAARAYRQDFYAIYPEQIANVAMNEYLAYMAVQAELIDRKKQTEAQAEYALAQKMSELVERAKTARAAEDAARMVAQQTETQRAAAARAEQQTTAWRAADNAAAIQLAREQQQIERDRLELERQVAQRQIEFAEQRERNDVTRAFVEAGIRLLTQPARRTVVCTGHWAGPTWVQHCN